MKKSNHRTLRMESLEGRELMATLGSPTGSSLVGPIALTANNDTISGATGLGNINGWLTQSSAVSGSDKVDFYKFQVGYSGPVRVQLSGLSRDVDIQIVNSSGTVLASSVKSGTAAEDLTVNLSSGINYYVKVYTYGTSTASSNYTLRIEAVAGNDTRTTATNIGSIAAGLARTLKSGVGGSIDTVDYYAFTVGPGTATRSVTINLSELNGDVDLDILDNTGRNIGNSFNGGTRSESVTLNLVGGRTYYVKVSPFGSAVSDYRLTVSVR